MDKLFQNNSGERSEHPSREMLLLFVDGELQAKEAAQLQEHLEACWPCRVKTQKIQDAIADIIEFDDQVLTPRLIPPQSWRNFSRKLSELVTASGKQSISSKLFGSLGRFLPSSRLYSLPRQLPRPVLRNAIVALLLIMLVALVIRFRHEPTVSAGQLLINSIEAQAQRIRRTSEPVVHQRLRISRKDQGEKQTINWEIWKDTKNSRVRQFYTEGKQSIVADELAGVLKANHMDATHPLSAASYRSWYNTLQNQRDEVTKSKLTDGTDGLILRTIPASPVNVGQIAEAIFVVQATDWQPAELRLNVVAEDGTCTYQLTATLSEVVTLDQVDPAIFADKPVVTPSPSNSVKEIAEKEKQPLAAVVPNPQPLNTTPTASADLEVEALRLLNQAGADLGEQITVKRTPAGVLEINGIVETNRRKEEIFDALGPIATNPAVHIGIRTVAEAVAQQTSGRPTPQPSTRAVEITSNVIAAEPELRAYFAGKGKDTDESIRQYAARMVSLSGRAMDHLWAMKRLFSQFSPEELRALTSEARSKLMGLIRSHARSYQQTTESIRRELYPIFFASQPLAAISPGNAIIDINDLTQTIHELFELGSSNDRAIRSAFTSSSGGATTTVIKTPQFLKSLTNAEGLAARIGRAQ